jgi:hypothetical protein
LIRLLASDLVRYWVTVPKDSRQRRSSWSLVETQIIVELEDVLVLVAGQTAVSVATVAIASVTTHCHSRHCLGNRRIRCHRYRLTGRTDRSMGVAAVVSISAVIAVAGVTILTRLTVCPLGPIVAVQMQTDTK